MTTAQNAELETLILKVKDSGVDVRVSHRVYPAGRADAFVEVIIDYCGLMPDSRLVIWPNGMVTP